MAAITTAGFFPATATIPAAIASLTRINPRPVPAISATAIRYLYPGTGTAGSTSAPLRPASTTYPTTP